MGICFLLALIVWCGALITDHNKLTRELIRLHVVANSDSQEDQTVKLKVRDAITESLMKDLQQIGDTQQALDYLRNQLPKLEYIANQVLTQAGMDPNAVVTLCKESFEKRIYDTFTLPAGVYHALRISIGEGEGKNWWCVAFPTLCQSATTAEFEEAAVEAGFSEKLTDTLAGEDGYVLRFYLLDCLGKLENKIFRE